MKFSIRVSILGLFATLMILIGIVIVGSNYYMSQKDVKNFLLSQLLVITANAEHEIDKFFQLTKTDSNYFNELITNKLINLDNSKNLTRLLVQILDDSPTFTAIHWTQPTGNSIYIEKNSNGTFIKKEISCKKAKCIQKSQNISDQANPISKYQTEKTTFDPHNRTWYQKAVQTKKFVLSDVYLFYDHPILGTTSAYPIYNSNKKLLGVFGIDIKITKLASFVAAMRLTTNSIMFIFDDKGQIIAAKELVNFKGNNVPTSDIFTHNWATKFFTEYPKYKDKDYSSFYYEFNNASYLATFKKIRNIPGVNWAISIIIPMTDIYESLDDNLATSAITGTILLFLGMFGVWLIARAISRPIVDLADDSALIRNLELSSEKKANSLIKEIFNMQDAFNAMKKSLRSFVRYVPFTLVKQLLTQGELAHVGGDYKKISCLFIDIKGFTSLSEKMEPSKLMEYLSEYFEVMTATILKKNGTVDKYIGDAIMAFWGAPLDDNTHAIDACECSLLMRENQINLNKHFKSLNLPEIETRVGINSGEVIVGNVGSEDRLNYTAIGDDINIASRLEQLGKVYGTKIIVSESTYKAAIANSNFVFRPLDYITVRGKQIAIHIYELLDKTNPLYAKISDYNNKFTLAFSFYKNANWDEALNLFKNLANEYPDDKVAKIYIERCELLKKNSPSNWDGIWKAT